MHIPLTDRTISTENETNKKLIWNLFSFVVYFIRRGKLWLLQRNAVKNTISHNAPHRTYDECILSDDHNCTEALTQTPTLHFVHTQKWTSFVVFYFFFLRLLLSATVSCLGLVSQWNLEATRYPRICTAIRVNRTKENRTTHNQHDIVVRQHEK